MEDSEFYRMAAKVIRYGKVGSIDTGNRTAKVFFQERNDMVSRDLKVLDRTMKIHEDYAGDPSHIHGDYNIPWMPEVGEWVLCICLPAKDGDGFVVGGVL